MITKENLVEILNSSNKWELLDLFVNSTEKKDNIKFIWQHKFDTLSTTDIISTYMLHEITTNNVSVACLEFIQKCLI